MKYYISVVLLTKVLHRPYFIKKDQRSAALVQVGGVRGQPTRLHLNPRDGARSSLWYPSAQPGNHCSVSKCSLRKHQGDAEDGCQLHGWHSPASRAEQRCPV